MSTELPPQLVYGAAIVDNVRVGAEEARRIRVRLSLMECTGQGAYDYRGAGNESEHFSIFSLVYIRLSAYGNHGTIVDCWGTISPASATKSAALLSKMRTPSHNNRDIDHRPQRLKLSCVFADDLIVEVAKVLGVHADHQGVGQFFGWSEILAVGARVVVNIQYWVTQRANQAYLSASGPDRELKLGAQTVEVRHAPEWMLLPTKPAAGQAIRALERLDKRQANEALQALKRRLSADTCKTSLPCDPLCLRGCRNLSANRC